MNVSEATRWVGENMSLAVLVLTRVSLLLMTMPAIGVGVPRRVRAMLAIMTTILLLGPVTEIDSSVVLPELGQWTLLAIAIGREALVGLLIGSTIQLVVTGLQTGGEIMTGTGGMQLGDAIDPSTGAAMPAVARMIGLLVVAILLAVGGHRWIMNTLIDSFHAMPAGNVRFEEVSIQLIVAQLSSGMAAGMKIAAPIVAALLLSNLVTGLISRTLPQINVLAIGLSVNALALLLTLSFGLTAVGYVFRTELDIALSRLATVF